VKKSLIVFLFLLFYCSAFAGIATKEKQDILKLIGTTYAPNGKFAWMCVMLARMPFQEKFRIELTKLIYSDPSLLKTCNETLPNGRNITQWARVKKQYSL